jgi:hypothetical protein
VNFKTLKAGVLYFRSRVLGRLRVWAIRTLYVVQLLGERIAELMEAAIMLVISIIAARWIVLHLAISRLLCLHGSGWAALHSAFCSLQNSL